MKQPNMADSIASEMDRILNSEESKQIFAPSKSLEKLAFVRVSDEDKSTEIAQELEVALDKTAQVAPHVPAAPAEQHKEECKACKGFYVRDDGGPQCTCLSQGLTAQDCKANPECHCHKHPATPVVNPVGWQANDGQHTVASMVAELSKISERLDSAGFEKLATVSLMLADRIVVEAKAKAKGKSSKKSEKKDSKKSPKKMTTKERMEKMRAGKAKAKKTETKSKKSK